MSYRGQTQTYQTRAAFISAGAYDSDQTVSGSIRQLSRIVDAQYAFNYPVQRSDYIDGGIEYNMVTPASVDVNLTWLHTNARNEIAVGLADLGVSGRMGFNLEQEKNLYVTIENTPGIDAIGATGADQTKTVIGLGQGLLNSYSLNAQVGGIIQSTASLNCLTAFIYSGSSGNRVPAVNHQDGEQLTGLFALPWASAQYSASSDDPTENVAAIGARDMVLVFPAGSPFGVVYTGVDSCYLQSFSLTLSPQRQEQKPLGHVYPTNRPIIWPMEVSLSTEAIVSRYQADQLSRLDCVTGFTMHLFVKQPCSNLTMFGFVLDNMQMDGQSLVTSIGDRDIVSTSWKGAITSPYTMLFDPTFNYLVNLADGEPWGERW